MIDFTDVFEDLEKTQRLPVLTAETQLDEVLDQERAASAEMAELVRHNLQLMKDLARLRCGHAAVAPQTPSFAGTIDRRVSTEEQLFEVCGALRDAFSKVLSECESRGLALHCGEAATRTFENSCEKFEQILSAHGFGALTAARADGPASADVSQASDAALRAKRIKAGKARRATHQNRPARLPNLEIVRSDA